MNGGLQQAARVQRSIGAEHWSDLEAFNRATHPDALREMQLDNEGRKLIAPIERQLQPPVIAPAEDLQADEAAPDAHPTLSPRFGLGLFIFVAAVIAHHAPWSAAL